MDAKAPKMRQDEIRIGDDRGFESLFAQLDHPDACAPIDQGLLRLMATIEMLRRNRPNAR
jgi:hypothetical protein